MDRVAVLGTGKVGKTLATRLSEVGFTVAIGSRDAGAAAICIGPTAVRVTDPASAVRPAAIAINAMPSTSPTQRSEAQTELFAVFSIQATALRSACSRRCPQQPSSSR